MKINRHHAWFGVLAAAALTAGPVLAETIDPTKVDADYAVQGEYVSAGKNKVGAQVIALSKGEFSAVLYVGGLPGDGWPAAKGKKEPAPLKGKGKTADGVTSIKGEGWDAQIKDGAMVIKGKVAANLKRVVRVSSTMGAKPPKGAVVLFDGKSADSFNNGKIVLKDLLLANVESKQKFGSHVLHLEFRTSYKPYARGQGRSNSGVYIQSRYELQVLDSFGLEGKNNECGGIYSISEPAFNMCYPPLVWQTYDIDFTQAQYDGAGKKTTNARATIRHNGVVIHDDLELTHGTPGKHKEGPGPDGIYLQGHGNKVVYRNIWVVEKK